MIALMKRMILVLVTAAMVTQKTTNNRKRKAIQCFSMKNYISIGGVKLKVLYKVTTASNTKNKKFYSILEYKMMLSLEMMNLVSLFLVQLIKHTMFSKDTAKRKAEYEWFLERTQLEYDRVTEGIKYSVCCDYFRNLLEKAFLMSKN